MNRFVGVVAVTIGLGLSVASAPARAAPHRSSHAERAERAEAAKKFRAGESAYRRHDYVNAAEDFLAANQILPHAAALFNAARSYEKAGQLSRAANLCARYLRDAPSNDRQQQNAHALIAELTPKLGRIGIDDNGAGNVRIDGKAKELDVTFVDPGDHDVSGEFDGKQVERHVSVVAGSLERVVLEPPQPKPAPAPPSAAPSASAPAEQAKPAHAHGWPRFVFYGGVAATAVLGGLTIWSGLDTNSARSDYANHPTRAGLDDGLGKEHRTNVLLAATAVVGVATAAIGVFATRWKNDPSHDSGVQVGIGPGAAVVRGTF
jgi:hypothetical protein